MPETEDSYLGGGRIEEFIVTRNGECIGTGPVSGAFLQNAIHLRIS